MVTTSTESHRRSQKVYNAKREAEGYKKATFWLTPQAREALEALKARNKSKDGTVSEAIILLESMTRPA